VQSYSNLARNRLRRGFDLTRRIARIGSHLGPFRKFERAVHPETWMRHDELLKWAEDAARYSDKFEAPRYYEQSQDPIVRQGYKLMNSVRQQFKGCLSEYKHLRFLIHQPPPEVSPAGFSVFRNLVQSLEFLGIAVRGLRWFDMTREALEDFQPTVLMTSDHDGYLSRIDWKAVNEYRRGKAFVLGLTASLQECGNTPLEQRLKWARHHDVDFYYSFHEHHYVKERYQAFFDLGYQILSIEFGANPLIYYPVPGIDRDLSYVFLGSNNREKWPRYFSYFGPVVASLPGFVDGPGWSPISRFGGLETHRFLCARARVGLNLHIQNQVDSACELNERTYNLAACGVPQLVDAPQLLFSRFQPDSFFVARTPTEYEMLFREILEHPEETQRRALQAQREVFEKQTIFHRAESFVKALQKCR
jgi:hypothetical protein